MSIDPYQPIACSLYDSYEIAIMRGQHVELHWLDTHGVEHRARIKPVGLQTREGEEFLLIVPDNAQSDIAEMVRLDRIIAMK